MPDKEHQRRTAARIGLLHRVVGVRRAQAPQGEPPPAEAEPEGESTVSPDHEAPLGEVELLKARVAHLEGELEGLQDAVDRELRRHDDDVAELRRRLEPAELARSLSADARRRGL